MKCPFCGSDNLAGEEECANCQEPLADLDGVVPRNKLEKSIMEDPIRRVETRGIVSVPLASRLSAYGRLPQLDWNGFAGKLAGQAIPRCAVPIEQAAAQPL